jgi:hypothetical protein
MWLIAWSAEAKEADIAGIKVGASVNGPNIVKHIALGCCNLNRAPYLTPSGSRAHALHFLLGEARMEL